MGRRKAKKRPNRNFGTPASPTSIIKSMCKEIDFLRPPNINTFVDELRKTYNEIYLSGTPNPEIGGDQIDKPVDYDEQTEAFKTCNLSTVIYCGVVGWWKLLITIEKDGRHDFTFGVRALNRYIFHPGQARKWVLHYSNERKYEEWKVEVKSLFDENALFLIDKASKKIPGFKSWSVTSSPSSERLMKRLSSLTPKVQVYKRVAFLFL